MGSERDQTPVYEQSGWVLAAYVCESGGCFLRGDFAAFQRSHDRAQRLAPGRPERSIACRSVARYSNGGREGHGGDSRMVLEDAREKPIYFLGVAAREIS